MLKAVKVRIYPTDEQHTHLAQAFGCARWALNQSLAAMSMTYKETGKGLSASDMKKQIPVWKNQATPPQADGVWKQICSRILDSDCKPVVFAAERRGIYPY